jgi:hypothetical protein
MTTLALVAPPFRAASVVCGKTCRAETPFDILRASRRYISASILGERNFA